MSEERHRFPHGESPSETYHDHHDPQYGLNDIGEMDINQRGHMKQDPENDGSSCNLIVNYLPHDVDDTTLKRLFADFGDISISKVVRDKTTKKSLGYGFVKFVREEDAQVAINKTNGLSLGHKTLKVSIARPPSLEIRNCKLYVTNLPRDYVEEDVANVFKEFGEIIECRVLRDRHTRYNKGVAFVQFNLKAQAEAALVLNGCQLEGSNKGLFVKYAEDQHKKREFNRMHSLSASYSSRGEEPNMQGGRSRGGVNQNHQNHQNQRNLHQQKHENMPQAFGMYYPAPVMDVGYEQGLSPLHSPMHMHAHQHMQHPLSPMHQHVHPQVFLYGNDGLQNNNNGNYGNNSGKKKAKESQKVPFPLELAEMQDNTMAQQSNWYHNMSHSPQLMSFMQSYQSSVDSLGIPSPPGSPHRLHQLRVSPPGSPLHLHHGHGGHGGHGGHNPPNYGGYPPLSPVDPRQFGKHQHLKVVPPDPRPQTPGSMVSPYSVGPVFLDIKNLPPHATEALLYELLMPYGRVLEAKIKLPLIDSEKAESDDYPPTVAGKVKMAGFAQAHYAANSLNGTMIFGGNTPIEVDLSAIESFPFPPREN